eukprot:Gb_31830 [translate_table: standard]
MEMNDAQMNQTTETFTGGNAPTHQKLQISSIMHCTYRCLLGLIKVVVPSDLNTIVSYRCLRRSTINTHCSGCPTQGLASSLDNPMTALATTLHPLVGDMLMKKSDAKENVCWEFVDVDSAPEKQLGAKAIAEQGRECSKAKAIIRQPKEKPNAVSPSCQVISVEGNKAINKNTNGEMTALEKLEDGKDEPESLQETNNVREKKSELTNYVAGDVGANVELAGPVHLAKLDFVETDSENLIATFVTGQKVEESMLHRLDGTKLASESLIEVECTREQKSEASSFACKPICVNLEVIIPAQLFTENEVTNIAASSQKLGKSKIDSKISIENSDSRNKIEESTKRILEDAKHTCENLVETNCGRWQLDASTCASRQAGIKVEVIGPAHFVVGVKVAQLAASSQMLGNAGNDSQDLEVGNQKVGVSAQEPRPNKNDVIKGSVEAKSGKDQKSEVANSASSDKDTHQPTYSCKTSNVKSLETEGTELVSSMKKSSCSSKSVPLISVDESGSVARKVSFYEQELMPTEQKRDVANEILKVGEHKSDIGEKRLSLEGASKSEPNDEGWDTDMAEETLDKEILGAYERRVSQMVMRRVRGRSVSFRGSFLSPEDKETMLAEAAAEDFQIPKGLVKRMSLHFTKSATFTGRSSLCPSRPSDIPHEDCIQ